MKICLSGTQQLLREAEAEQPQRPDLCWERPGHRAGAGDCVPAAHPTAAAWTAQAMLAWDAAMRHGSGMCCTLCPQQLVCVVCRAQMMCSNGAWEGPG